MAHHKLAFLGFGNVGKSLAQLLMNKRAELIERYNLTFSVTGIATGRHGVAIDPNGIDLEQALRVLSAQEALDRISTIPVPLDSFDFIRRCGADVLFENTPVNYTSGQPAVDYIQRSLELGIHVVTANKGPVVHAYRRLTELAQDRGVKFLFESSVMDGAPIFSLFRETLPAAQLHSFRGVLNSTTNLILTRMETGETFDQAVAYAKKIGIAETDPSGDIDGWDASVKVAALVTVIMGIPLKPQEVDRQGIRQITSASVLEAAGQGKRWKLVCSAQRYGDQVKANVRPELVDRVSPLYAAEGTTSIMQFETDVLGKLSILEENPGPMTTAYGCMADFINAVSDRAIRR
jgi:homoserine dehydrogenase